MEYSTLEIGDMTGPNAGYIKELILIKKCDLEMVENPILYPNDQGYQFITGSMRLKTNEPLKKIIFAWRKCAFSETQEKTPNGYIYNNSILWEWPKHNPVVQKFLLENEHHEFVAFFRDGNELFHIAGNCDVGLELMYTRSITDINNVSVSLTGLLPFPSLFSAETDLSSLFQAVEFSTEFSTEFNA